MWRLFAYPIAAVPSIVGLLDAQAGAPALDVIKDFGIAAVLIYALTRVDKIVEKSDARWKESAEHQAKHYAELQGDLLTRLDEIAEERREANSALLEAIKQLSQPSAKGGQTVNYTLQRPSS